MAFLFERQQQQQQQNNLTRLTLKISKRIFRERHENFKKPKSMTRN